MKPKTRSAWSRSDCEPAMTPTLPAAAAGEAADQRAGGAAGGDVVDADVMVAARAGHVGDERHDMGVPAATRSSIAARTLWWSSATTATPS